MSLPRLVSPAKAGRAASRHPALNGAAPLSTRFALSLFLIPVALAALLLSCSNGGGTIVNPPPPPPPPALNLELAPAVTGFTQPLDLQQPPGELTSRLFVVEKTGRIRIINSSGAILSPPFLDISTPAFALDTSSESGLLGLAFHPNFQNDPRFFIYYVSTRNGRRQSIVSEFTVSSPSSNTATVASERRLLEIDQTNPDAGNHKAGQLAFGPDGFLYIALGDGGGGGDPAENAENINVLLGKILRIDINSTSFNGLYGIPPGNPFAGATAGRDEIWAHGLRNPFRFSFDRGSNPPRMFIADVGQDRFEEIDLVADLSVSRIRNFGWDILEGNECFEPMVGCTMPSNYIAPIHVYPRSDGASVIGGYVYRGATISNLVGAYVFGDFISGRIWTLTQDAQSNWVRTQVFSVPANNLSSFGVDLAGNLYAIQLTNGSVSRFRQVGSP